MELNNIKNILSWLGNKFGLLTQRAVNYLSSLGINLSQSQSKLLNLIIIGLLLLMLFKFIETPKKIVKWGVIILSLILALSTIISFI